MEEGERRSLLRIVDANSNRASEALRVAEDVCRFHWNLPGFAADLKALRHEVLDAVAPGLAEHREMLESRDVRGDVGREAQSPGRAADVETMALRNLQRAREALRVLEEAFRIEQPERAARLEKARYTLYAIEKGLAHLPPLGEAPGRIALAQICLIATARLAARPLDEVVAAAVDAGVDFVQLREKGPSDREILRSARALRDLTARRGVLFIVNDRPDIALRAAADGVHLGQDDLPVAE
ncbi:MAG TPA: thiamine phosphate synthase, partial [Planctomycetota bacterium]|nr:thiamine phosphate synthase [Planctomycetota bacterium]